MLQLVVNSFCYSQAFLEILGLLIMLMIRSPGRTAPHEQVALIGLKRTIYNKFVQVIWWMCRGMLVWTRLKEEKQEKIYDKNTKDGMSEQELLQTHMDTC